MPVGFNDDPESGLTGRPLRKVSMGNFSVLGVMLGYTEMPLALRKFGINTFPPDVGREVHQALLALVAAGSIRPVIGRRISMAEVAGALDRPRAAADVRPDRRRRGARLVGRMPDLVPDDVLAEARAADRPRRLRPPATSARGSRVLCASITDEAELSELGAAAVRGTIVSSLANRLRVVDWIRRHPEVADEPIEAPLVVIGMFRAGTTFLSELLDQDPRNRALLRWEASDSAPPPSPATLPVGPTVDARPRSAASCSSRSTPA